MNLNKVLNLEPGTLFKGIDNSDIKKMILNTTYGWRNPFTGSYVIQWHSEKKFEKVLEKIKYRDSLIFINWNSTLKERIELTKFNNGTRPDFYSETKTIVIGDVVGMFLGEVIMFSIAGCLNNCIFLKTLDKQEIGWLELRGMKLVSSNYGGPNATFDTHNII